MKKAFGLLFLLWASLSFAGSTFLRQYEHAGEVITKVNTVKITDSGTIILSLEGYYTQTNAPFSRVQSFSIDGDLLNDYSDAYVGEPSRLGSGLFDLNHFTFISDSLAYKEILTPVLTPLPADRFRFDWRIGYPDSTGSYNYTENLLPDSLDTVVEFPTAINHYNDTIFNGDFIYLVGGRGIFNGVYRCFALDVFRQEFEYYPILYFPGLQHISGLTALYGLDEFGFLAIGQANGWTGKIIKVDGSSNVLWQQDFTDGCDASQIPIFTTPLLSYDQNYALQAHVAISYQNRDRIMHIALYYNQALQTIYSEQLDAYIEAIPLYNNNGTVTFAYLKNGVQIIRQIDYAGNTIWSRELPGIGSFGKNSLTLCFSLYPSGDYLVSGRMSNGGYYLAHVNGRNGRISYDTISQPETMKMSIYPNPSEDIVNISFDLKQSGKVKLELYNLKGQKAMELQHAFFPKGKYLFSYALSPIGWENISAGVYLLRLEQNGKHLTQKLIFLHRRYGVPVIKSATY